MRRTVELSFVAVLRWYFYRKNLILIVFSFQILSPFALLWVWLFLESILTPWISSLLMWWQWIIFSPSAFGIVLIYRISTLIPIVVSLFFVVLFSTITPWISSLLLCRWWIILSPSTFGLELVNRLRTLIPIVLMLILILRRVFCPRSICLFSLLNLVVCYFICWINFFFSIISRLLKSILSFFS